MIDIVNRYYITLFLGSDLKAGDLSKGKVKQSQVYFYLTCGLCQVLTAYAGPSPPPATGPHRYVVTAYQQPGSRDLAVRVSRLRARFNIEKFARKARGGALTLVAGNFFLAENK